MLIVAFAQFIHFIVTGEVEDEPLEEELDKEAVKLIKAWAEIEEKQDREALARIKARSQNENRAENENDIAEEDYEESERVSAGYKRERELADKDWEDIQKETANDWEESKMQTAKYSAQIKDPLAAYISISPSAKKIWDERQAAELGFDMEKQGEKLSDRAAEESKEALRRRRVSHASDQIDPTDQS